MNGWTEYHRNGRTVRVYRVRLHEVFRLDSDVPNALLWFADTLLPSGEWDPLVGGVKTKAECLRLAGLEAACENCGEKVIPPARFCSPECERERRSRSDLLWVWTMERLEQEEAPE